MISHKRLLELLDYDPETGVFRWRVDRWRAKAGDIAGWCRPDGYVCIGIDQRAYRAHRLAWFYVHAHWPGEVDHIDRNRSNNTIANLREASRAQNSRNNTGHADARSGRKGVTWNAATQTWRAQIYAGGKQKFLGLFGNKDDAARAYDRAAEVYFGEFAVTNASLGNRGEHRPC